MPSMQEATTKFNKGGKPSNADDTLLTIQSEFVHIATHPTGVLGNPNNDYDGSCGWYSRRESVSLHHLKMQTGATSVLLKMRKLTLSDVSHQGGYAAPTFADLDGDGKAELVVGAADTITLYRFDGVYFRKSKILRLLHSRFPDLNLMGKQHQFRLHSGFFIPGVSLFLVQIFSNFTLG